MDDLKEMNRWKVMAFIIMMPLVMGCTRNHDDHSEIEESAYAQEMTDELIGTSWKFYRWVPGAKNMGEYDVDAIITFGSDGVLCVTDCKTVLDGYVSFLDGKWYFKDDKLVLLAGTKVTHYIGVTHQILTLNSKELVLLDDSGKERYFSATNNKESGGNNSNTSKGDAPYVINYNYTATKNSITVKFTCTERPTSATVKYGTTSATHTINSSIAGKQVTATASGLQSGTKYTFKITVSNAYGSSTSSDWPAMTNY